MSSNLQIQNSFNDIFGVKHYNVKVLKKKENIFKFIVSVLSYALFVWLLLVGGMLLLYVADIKIRAAKGDYSAPVFNAYVVLSGSMLPEIEVKDIVVTKKVSADDLEVGDIITFIAPDSRYGGISITHRIIEKYYDESLGTYSYRTKGDANNVADASLVPNDNVLGKVILKIPKLGYLQDILSSKGGLIIVVLIPCLTILSYDIMKILKKIGIKANVIKE
mgnify:CR=1 FL=1